MMNKAGGDEGQGNHQHYGCWLRTLVSWPLYVKINGEFFARPECRRLFAVFVIVLVMGYSYVWFWQEDKDSIAASETFLNVPWGSVKLHFTE